MPPSNFAACGISMVARWRFGASPAVVGLSVNASSLGAIAKYEARRRNLLWGVRAFHYDKFASTDQTINDVNKIAFEKGYVEKDDMVISLAAMPMKEKGMVNTMRVSEVKDYSKE